MKKIIGTIISLLLFGALCFLIGFGLSESLQQKEKDETLSKNSVQPTQKKIYVIPEEEQEILAGYNEDKLVSIDRYPLFTFKEPFNNRVIPFSESLGKTKEEVEKTPEPTQIPTPTPVPTPEPPAPTPEPVDNSNGTLIGSDFKLYHYAPTGNATASGRMPVVGTTVAVDPRYIKLGTWLRIEIPDGNGGYKVYKQKVRADDTGGAIKGHVLDIFVGSESEARQCGVIRNARVYIVEE